MLQTSCRQLPAPLGRSTVPRFRCPGVLKIDRDNDDDADATVQRGTDDRA